MFRIVLIALVIYIFWKLLRWVFGTAKKTKRMEIKPQSLEPAEMVACAKCGTFVVKADTMRRSGKEFCSENCLNGN